ncbi:MAG: hypothetical protein AAGJ93_11345, partial [Bacteroidota bacterium]
MKNHLLVIACFLLMSSVVFAQDSLIIENLRGHIYELSLEQQKITGPGAGFLEDIAQKSPFFLIGEDHGLAEMPLFTAAVLKAFRPFGYKYLATETGPYTAAYLEQLAGQDGWMETYASFLKEYPWSIPFYGWEEECRMLDALLVDNENEGPLLWGLDQEFAAGYRLNFLQLVDQAEAPESKALAKRYYDRAISAYEASFGKGNPQAALMMQLQASDFDSLKQVFAQESDNLNRINELERTP